MGSLAGPKCKLQEECRAGTLATACSALLSAHAGASGSRSSFSEGHLPLVGAYTLRGWLPPMPGAKGLSSVRVLQGSVPQAPKFIPAHPGRRPRLSASGAARGQNRKSRDISAKCGFYPADHQNRGPCNISHQTHVFTEEVRVIQFRKNEFQVRPIYPLEG